MKRARELGRRQTKLNASALLGAALQVELRRVTRKLVEAEHLIKKLCSHAELCSHEGAQDWPKDLRKRLDKYKMEGET